MVLRLNLQTSTLPLNVDDVVVDSLPGISVDRVKPHHGRSTYIEVNLVRRDDALHRVQFVYGIIEEFEHREYSVVGFDERVNVRLEAAHYEITTRV